VNPAVPLPDAEGWITLFDGNKLSGCPAEAIAKAGRKIRIENGALLLDNTWVQFPITARNVAVRADVRKVSGTLLGLGCREHPGNRKYSSWFRGGGTRHGDFGIGMADPKWRGLKAGGAARNFEDFFQMTFIARDGKFILNAGGEDLVEVDNMEINDAGKISIRALQGLSQFKNIQVRILDPSPSLE
jgi:hypothetical protein